MKQFKVKIIGIGTGKDGWRNIHANNEQEAYEKATKLWWGICEVIDVKKHRGRK